MSDILERWPILDLYELLTPHSARFQITKSGLTKEIKSHNGKRFLKCPNPDHEDKRPSCRFNEKTDHFKCFSLGCGGNGRKVDLIKLALGMPETASNADAIAALKQLDPSAESLRSSLLPQPLADPRFRDGEWLPLDNEHLAYTFSYYDLDGTLRYQVLRYHGFEPGTKTPAKRFAQRRPLPAGQWVRDKDRFVYVDVKGNPLVIPDGSGRFVSVSAKRRDGSDRVVKGTWFYNLDGIERIPYRLRELRQACEAGRVILLPEGEPHTDCLRDLSFASTTNSEGSSFAYPEHWKQYFIGARAILIPSDCDASGRIAARSRARALEGAAPVVAPLDIWPERNDKYDIWNFVRDDLRGLPCRDRTLKVRDLLRTTLERDGLRELIAA